MSTAESKNLSHGRVEHAEHGSFEQMVLQSSVPVLVDFYADWCGPCRMIAPVLDDVAREVPGARVVKVNVDHNPELASAYGISSIPSLMVFKDGEVIARHVGVASKDRLKNLLAR
ncbi:MAG: thioredoxin [Thermoguttaceae bacterium]|nr:thioredoxin [Thermoguttaceae bacterium]